MLGAVEMLGGVLVLGGVAAADMAAGPADTQMQPFVAALETLLATFGAGRDLGDRVQMRTKVFVQRTPSHFAAQAPPYAAAMDRDLPRQCFACGGGLIVQPRDAPPRADAPGRHGRPRPL